MITLFKNYETLAPVEPSDDAINQDAVDFIEFEKKILCLESYWNDDMFDNLSIKPFFDQLGSMMEENITVSHRFIESGKGLKYYTSFPKGKIWKNFFQPPIIYLALHGKSGGRLLSGVKNISPDELCEAFTGYDKWPTLVYFGSCEVFKGDEGKAFAQKFLKTTGVRACIGYSEMVSFIDALLIDMLFLSRFFTIRDAYPFNYLKSIYDWVLEDIPQLTLESGYSLFINEDYRSSYSSSVK